MGQEWYELSVNNIVAAQEVVQAWKKPTLLFNGKGLYETGGTPHLLCLPQDQLMIGTSLADDENN
jgi:hypothetical protein